jgi:predicted ribosomally synthesized peptide with SipW-like signal peptide
MKKILLSLLTVGLVSAAVFGATQAAFSDTEEVLGNTFTAGTLDLEVDGENPLASAKFSVSNMRPDNQPKGTFHLNNIGSVNGLVDLRNIVVTGYENVCHEPELEAGDSDCGNPGQDKGELENVVNLRLFVDEDCNGWIGTGDNVFYNDKVSNLLSSYDLGEELTAGSDMCVTAIFDWWNTADDNLAQSDSMELDIDFVLEQE